MTRMLLTFWFTLTTLIGPGLCCCTLRIALSAAAESNKPKCSCCEAEVGDQSYDSGESKPGCPDKEKCPCKRDRSVDESLARSSGSFKATAVIGLLYWLDSVTVSESHDVGSYSITPLDRTRPFHSTDELLNVFHILRC